VNPPSMLERDRYVATNRFTVRSGQEAKFEQRWANRKSRLATLPGFRYFHLMRRMTLGKDEGDGDSLVYDGGQEDEGMFGNYVSFTIWEKKSHFDDWRKGDAFREAHGGTSIGAFVSAMVNSAFLLKTPPKPAMYDGILVQTTPAASMPSDDGKVMVNGWRKVDADGVHILPGECFVACNQFFVQPDRAAAFEERWASRESRLQECDGFVAFSMLRRDTGGGGGHNAKPMDPSKEPNYVSTTIWRDRQAFEGWKKSQAFKSAHGSGKPPATDTKDGPPTQQGPPPLWSKPPQPVFYEGTLVISSEEGV